MDTCSKCARTAVGMCAFCREQTCEHHARYDTALPGAEDAHLWAATYVPRDLPGDAHRSAVEAFESPQTLMHLLCRHRYALEMAYQVADGRRRQLLSAEQVVIRLRLAGIEPDLLIQMPPGSDPPPIYDEVLVAFERRRLSTEAGVGERELTQASTWTAPAIADDGSWTCHAWLMEQDTYPYARGDGVAAQGQLVERGAVLTERCLVKLYRHPHARFNGSVRGEHLEDPMAGMDVAGMLADFVDRFGLSRFG